MSEAISTSGTRRCVVLHAKGHKPPEMLLTSLTRRGLDVSTTQSVHRTLAQLALAQRAGESCVLVLSEPKRIPSLARLTESVERFAPRTLLWAFKLGATPPLGPFALAKPEPTPESAPELPRPVRGPTQRPNQPPSLRLTGSSPSAPSSAEILDPDELDALLKPYDQ